MSSPRIRRLQSDYEKMTRRFGRSSLIRIESTDGVPPEKYVVTYSIKGLYAEPDGTLKERSLHRMEVNLTLGYPRRQPQCKMLTPIFHPNITESSVCAGDFYAASEGLDDLIIRIGRMIAYQAFNVKSPLNGIAARWAEKNDSRLPVDPRELAPSESTSPSAAPASQPPPLRGSAHIAINPTDISGTSPAAPHKGDDSLKITREDQANAIRLQIDAAWQSRDFDKVEHLLKAYAAVSGEKPDDLGKVTAALSVERYLEESVRTCESATAKIRSKAFSTAVAELDALPPAPESPSSDYEARLREVREQLAQAKREAADKWVLSVRNDVWQLCQGDKDRYAGVKTAMEELNKIPLSKEDLATIREQIATEARRTRAACIEKDIERATAATKWEAVLELCAELEVVDPGSVAPGTHRANATRHLQEALGAEIASAWQKRDLDSTESLLNKYVERWRRLTDELTHVQRCLEMERFLAKAASTHAAAEAEAMKNDYPGAVAALDGIPKAPTPPKDSYAPQLASVTGKIAKLRQEAINDWITTIDRKVRAACHGDAKDFRRVDSIVAETRKIPLGDNARNALQERLQKDAVQERCQALAAKLKAACEQRDWPLVLALCDNLDSLDAKSETARTRRKHAENGIRLDTGVLEAADAFAAGKYVECANQCGQLAKEHDAESFRFQTDTFKGTLTELRKRARKKEAEFLAAVDNVRKASDSNDWRGVSHWAEAARKLKPKDETVAGLVSEAHRKRVQIKRRATFRAIRRAAALVMLCAIAFFVYHHARLWYTFDSALKDADETAAFEAAKQVQWFYGPAARFVSALDERSLLKSAQIAATGILGHAHDGNWSAAQRAFSEGQKAWEKREFDTAAERWSEARNCCQRVVHAAVPLTISLSPALADAFIRLGGSDNQQLAVERGASLSLEAVPGHYRMDIEHPDYEPHHGEVAIAAEGGEEMHVHTQLTPLPGKLFVQCEPAAAVMKDGTVIGKTGEAVVLPAGEHVVEIAAKHYESALRTVSIDPNGEASLDLDLQPLPRRLLVKCEPVASVLLDGRAIGKTDEDLTIPVGPHRITLAAEGYKSNSYTHEVSPGRDVKIDTTLDLIPLPGKLLFHCTPKAQVFADGELVGVTGEPISLTEGKHHVEVVADGYLRKVWKDLEIPLGRDVKWTGSLNPVPGYLLVEATVPVEYGKPQHAPTARLTIGDETKTVTLPYRETGLPPGKHKVHIEVQGYEEVPGDTLTIVSGEWTRMPLTIIPKPATVCCVPNPPDAKIEIYIKTWKGGVGRDTKIGEGGEKLELVPFVQHDLIIKAKGYQQTYKSFSLPHPGRHHGDLTIDLVKKDRWR